MRIYIVATVLALGALSAPLSPTNAEETCQLKRYGVVDYETDSTAHIYIPATIEGISTHMMLDTGAFWSVMRRDLAEAANLSIGNADFYLYDAVGEKLTKSATADTKLGTLGYGKAEFFVSPPVQGVPIEKEGGVIGQNLLAKVDIEIDNAGRKISFFSQDHCKGEGVYWADEAVTLTFKKQPKRSAIGSNLKKFDKNQIDMPIVAAELEGETISVLFDTGATYSVLDIDHAKRRFGVAPGSSGVTASGKLYSGSGQEMDTYTYTFKTLTIAGIKFENVPVRLAKLDDSAQFILGMNEMKKLRLYFASKDGMIHITAADAGRTK